MEVIVECTKCGAEYKPGIAVQDSEAVTLAGNLTRCPQCGEMNRVEDRFIHKI